MPQPPGWIDDDDPLVVEARLIADGMVALWEAHQLLAEIRRRLVIQLLGRGYAVRAIGRALHLNHQQVSRIGTECAAEVAMAAKHARRARAEGIGGGRVAPSDQPTQRGAR